MQMKAQEFDWNLFLDGKSTRFVSLSYVPGEHYKMLEYLDDFGKKHSVTTPVKNLISAIHHFRLVTSTMPELVEARTMNLSSSQKKAILSEMSEAIKTALHQLMKIKNQQRDYEFLKSAINYTLKSLQLQLSELKQTNDELFLKYWPESDLKEMLEEEGIRI